MQTTQSLSADWTQVLARVEAALGKAVQRLAEREQALAASPAPSQQSVQPLNFAKYEERMAAFAAFPRPAEKRFEQLDTALVEGEDALRQWLTQAEAVRKRLAAWAGPVAK